MARMEVHKEVLKLHPLERKVLPHIKKGWLSKIEEATGLKEVEVMRAIQWLQNKGFVRYEKVEEKYIELDELGRKYVEEELPEIKLLKILTEEYITISEAKEKSELSNEEINVSLGILKRKGLIYTLKNKKGELEIARSEPARVFLSKYKNPLKVFKTPKNVNELSTDEVIILREFKKRKKILKEKIIKDFKVELTETGSKIAKELENLKDELLEEVDSNIIREGIWRKAKFRHYNIEEKVPLLETIGRRHPLIESNNILRDIFLEMGFKEMEGPMVESAFWNMDVMWIPQDHPARDEQDTFYLDGEAEIPEDLAEAYKEMHEEGIKRTHTPKGGWSKSIAKRRLLRTHSTATTFRLLAELGERLKKGENINGKYFYLATVFRNEAIDATHLAEFFQAEGFIIGDNLSLADLMGFVREYYAKLGITKIRFKPTFNPYTEPSMEAHYYDSKMNKWYALINSGIFRPETLKPLGLEKKRIIAWGMGANRVATLLTGLENMRDVTRNDLEWLKYRKALSRNISR